MAVGIAVEPFAGVGVTVATHVTAVPFMLMLDAAFEAESKLAVTLAPIFAAANPRFDSQLFAVISVCEETVRTVSAPVEPVMVIVPAAASTALIVPVIDAFAVGVWACVATACHISAISIRTATLIIAKCFACKTA